ncbi:MAG: NAD(+)/NADH kinase [Acidimicrobiales bacterium]
MARRLGLVTHLHRPEVRELAHRAIEWCGDDVVACLPTADAELIERPDLAVSEAAFGEGLDICLSLGGDGTMLRSSQLVSVYDVPILGVNAGRLGYLTEVDPDHMIQALERWDRGDLLIEERMMIEVRAERPDGGVFTGLALNEAVLSASETGRSLEVLTSIDGEPFSEYLADGVIIATPTGSTAYSLSAGGPIVEPDFHAILLTPVAAHMVFNRSLVLAPTTEVTLTVLGYRGAALALDGGTVLDLEPGESVTCLGSQRTAKLLVHGDRDFHTILKEKFRLVDEECS